MVTWVSDRNSNMNLWGCLSSEGVERGRFQMSGLKLRPRGAFSQLYSVVEMFFGLNLTSCLSPRSLLAERGFENKEREIIKNQERKFLERKNKEFTFTSRKYTTVGSKTKMFSLPLNGTTSLCEPRQQKKRLVCLAQNLPLEKRFGASSQELGVTRTTVRTEGQI